MLCRSAPFPGFCRGIYDGIRPCIADQVKVRVFIHDRHKPLLYIPAVAEDDDIPFPAEFGHHSAYHGGCKFQLRFFLLPHTVSKRDGKIGYLVFVSDGDTEHDADKTVPMQVI